MSFPMNFPQPMRPPGGPMGMPGSAALPALPPDPTGLGMDPAAAMMGGVTPEMQAQVAQMLQDPAARDQIFQMFQDPAVKNQIAQMAQSGQLPPEVAAQMLSGAPPGFPGTAPTGVPGFPGLPGFPPGGGITLGHLIKTGAFGIGMGALAHHGLKAFMGSESKLTGFLKFVDQLPGIGALNRKITEWLGSAGYTGTNENPIKRLLVEGTSEEAHHNYMQRLVGPEGHYKKEIEALLQKAKLPTGLDKQKVLAHITAAGTVAPLHQVLENDWMHFLPKAVKEQIQQETAEGSVIEGMLKSLTGSAVKPSPFTLQKVDQLMVRHELVKFLEKAAEDKGIQQQLFEKLVRPIQNVTADEFVVNIEGRLLKNRAYSKIFKQLLGLSDSVRLDSYAAFEKAFSAKIGRKPIWQVLNASTKNVLKAELKAHSAWTVNHVAKHFNKHHIAGTLAKNGVGAELQSLLGGVLKRAKYLEAHTGPIHHAEHLMQRTLAKSGVGPVGRLMGRALFYMQRVISGPQVSKTGLEALKSSQQSGFLSKLSKIMPGQTLLTSLFMFVWPAWSYMTSPNKESRVARLFETMATTISGYLGFQVGSTLTHDLGLLSRGATAAKFSTTPVGLRLLNFVGLARKFPKLAGFLQRLPLPKIPVTAGGFLAEMVFPMVVAAGFSWVARRLSYMVVGNPDTIDRRVMFAGDQNRPLTSSKSVLGPLASGQDIAQIPGITPNSQPFYQDPNAFDHKVIGLTPQQIGVSQRAIIQDQEVRRILSGH